MSKHEMTLDELWESTPEATERFDPDRLDVPSCAKRYLQHAIAPGTPLADAVRLRSHGQLRLGKSWYPFEAEQVLRWDKGMIWSARVYSGWGDITGSDRFLEHSGSMRWKLWGLIPVLTAGGPDITRSAIGRVEAESLWLPSVLTHDDVIWTEEDADHPHAIVTLEHETTELCMALGPGGSLTSVHLPRWGNPEGGDDYHWVDFGVKVEAERTFGGYTIPSTVRAGWHFDSPAFDEYGEFIRMTVDSAEYR